MDGLISTPINSTDCADTNFSNDTVDRLIMLMCLLLLQDWWYGVNAMTLETMDCL